jgi:hypothetical protein
MPVLLRKAVYIEGLAIKLVKVIVFNGLIKGKIVFLLKDKESSNGSKLNSRPTVVTAEAFSDFFHGQIRENQVAKFSRPGSFVFFLLVGV